MLVGLLAEFHSTVDGAMQGEGLTQLAKLTQQGDGPGTLPSPSEAAPATPTLLAPGSGSPVALAGAARQQQLGGLTAAFSRVH